MTDEASEKEDLHGRIAGGTALVVLGTAVSAGSAFTLRVLLANYLGPSNYGTITLGITFISTLAIIGVAGLDSGLSQRLPRSDERKMLIKGSIAVSLVVSLVLAVFLYLGAPLAATVIDARYLEPVLRLFAVALPLLVFVRVGAAAMQGLEDVTGKVFGQNIAYKSGLLVFAGIGVTLSLDTVAIATAWVLALALASLVIAYLLTKSELGMTPEDWSLPARDDLMNGSVRSLLIFSLPLMFSKGMWTLMENTDNLLIGVFIDGSGVGVYGAAFTIGRVFSIATGSVGVLFTPVFSDLHGGGNESEMRRFYVLTAKWIGFTTLIPYLVLITMTDRVILTLFSPAYLDARIALIFVSTGLFLHAITGLNGGAITAVGDSKSVLSGTIVAYIVNVVLNLILIPVFGITGAAIASAASFMTLNIYWLYLLYMRFRIFPFSLRYTVTILSSLIISGGVLLISHGTLGWVAVLVATLIHGVIIIVVGLSEDDQEFIHERISDVRSMI